MRWKTKKKFGYRIKENNMDIKNLKLEKFVGYGSKVSRKISLHKSESFGFPPAFFQENGVEDYQYINLYFDKDNKVIAMKMLKEKPQDGGYKIIKYGLGERRGASFNARSFFNNQGMVAADFSGKYDYQMENIDGIGDVYLIELKKKSED